MKAFYRKYRRFLLFILLYGMKAAVYFLLNRLPLERTVVHTAIDDRIPFVPAFVVFYISWFAYVPGMVLFASLRDKNLWRRTMILLFSGIALASLCFALFPTCLPGRPEPGKGLFGFLLSLIYLADKPTNLFPSLHCYEAVILHLCIFCKSPYGKNRGWRILSALLCTLICASTLLIKQHAFPDLVSGVGMAFVLWGLYSLFPWKKHLFGGTTHARPTK